MLLGEGVLEATTLLYKHAMMVALALGANKPVICGGASLRGSAVLIRGRESSVNCPDGRATPVPGWTCRLYVLFDILLLATEIFEEICSFFFFLRLGIAHTMLELLGDQTEGFPMQLA